ncbi:FecR family protein [Asticcacaulis sp. W401b]|uniref:FecR family protein n=1 Tax=Asticcacaulis sp. W401b TaxID=3388666 RepID=UPI00397089E9
MDADDKKRLAAEASAWLVRLQDGERTLQTDAAFRAWLKTSPDAAEAFARVTDLWELLPGAAAQMSPVPAKPAKAFPVRRALFLGGAIAAAVVLGIGVSPLLRTQTLAYETGVGQRESATLPDGTAVMLNTNSRILVSYSAQRRRVTLERGEVWFDIRHDADRPFIVYASGEQVEALGTAFVVRGDPQAVAVTLARGRVRVGPADEDRAPSSKLSASVILSPGERAIVVAGERLVVDRPSLEAVMAWRRGEIIFSDTTLSEAARELNRYNTMRIVITDPKVARLRVSGVFETSNAQEFAATMAQLNGLHARRSGEVIELGR